MTWQEGLQKILKKHLSDDKTKKLIYSIEKEASAPYKFKFETNENRGFIMPIYTSAYVVCLLYFDLKNNKVIDYSMDEKGGIAPIVNTYPLSEDDFEVITEIDKWPAFSVNQYNRMREAPYLDDVIEGKF